MREPSNLVNRALAGAVLVCAAFAVLAQTPTGPPTGATGVIRLSVKIKVGDSLKPLSRKRFFLIKGSLADNKTIVDSIEQRAQVSRDCYYRGLGVSEQLIKWLKEGDGCESVYCREVAETDLTGNTAVPEFQRAVAAGEKEFGSRDLARQWLTVNLPENIRSGFYRRQQDEIQAIIKQAEAASHTLMSVMTDRKGFAYFTEVPPGKYFITNIVPTETGANSVIWNCDVELKADEVGTEKPFSIPARKAGVCKVVEKALPECKPTSAAPGVKLSGSD